MRHNDLRTLAVLVTVFLCLLGTVLHETLEELLFFVVVPVAAIMTLEAVRVVRRWPVGDEPP